jgi:hypothetical protein
MSVFLSDGFLPAPSRICTILSEEGSALLSFVFRRFTALVDRLESLSVASE